MFGVLSLLRSWSDELRPVGVRLLAYLGGIAVLAALFTEILSAPEVSAAITPVERPDWITVERPHPAFELPLPEFADADLSYAIRRHALGGGRKDILTLGEPGRSPRAILIELYRPGAEIASFTDAAIEIADRTSDLHRIGAIRPLPSLETKFGSVALFDFLIRPDETVSRCTGFLRTSEKPRLQLSGFFCQAGDVLANRAQLVCALDRLTLLSAGSDPSVAGLFARAELNRKFCGHRSTLMAATPKRPMPGANEPLRLRGRIVSN